MIVTKPFTNGTRMPSKRTTPPTIAVPGTPPGTGSLLPVPPPAQPAVQQHSGRGAGAGQAAQLKSAPKLPAGLPIGERAGAVLKLAYRAHRAVLLEGPTGIGKSELVKQVADELGIGFAVLDLSLLEPPDLVGLPVIADGRTRYAIPAALPTDGAGLLLLEELNRADRTVQQPALQLLTARKLHEYELPPGWVPFAAINPEDGEYQVAPLDPALRCRFLQLKVRADIRAWREWAQQNQLHPIVQRLAQLHDDLLDTVPPRTWTYVSQIVSAMSAGECENDQFVGDVLGGYLPSAWAKRLRDELAKATDGIDPSDAEVLPLLHRYHTDGALQAQLRELRTAGHTDHFHQLARRLLEIVDGAELLRLIDASMFNLDAFDALLADLPGDLRASVQKAIGEQTAAARLLPLGPEQIADSQYATSARMATVAAWVNDALKRHRAVILAKCVARWLDSRSATDMGILKQKRAALSGLIAFARQVRGVGQHDLDDALARHGIV
jgi:MoxR-like ATPase